MHSDPLSAVKTILEGHNQPMVPPIIGIGQDNTQLSAIGENTEVDELEGLRRDPEEEYFMLAVLANKMIHSELYDPEYVYEINAKKLFG